MNARRPVLPARLVAAACAAIALRAAPARPEEPDAEPSAERFVALGPTRAQRDSSAPQLDFPFLARADEHLTSARVVLALSPPGRGEGRPEGLELSVNDERLAVFGADELAQGPRVREIAVPGKLLSDRNQLSLRLRDREGRCVARPFAWSGIESIGVAARAAPVPLPDELSLLPLPFYDRDWDARAAVPVVLARAAGPGEARLAALVAAWFAVDAPIPLRFDARIGALPDAPAVVLVSSAADADALGLPRPAGPGLRILDHPLHPRSNVKLLMVSGRTPAELAEAVEALAAHKGRLAGPEVQLRAGPVPPPEAPWSAPRWVPSDRPVPFARYPERGTLVHEGTAPATLSVRFRAAPDLWLWPRDFMALDLGWSERLPRGIEPPRLDVEINGYYLATLPPSDPGGAPARLSLRIPREHLRGFNQLLVHVHYPVADPCRTAPAETPAPGDGPRVALSGDSVLHFEGLPHFARLPDVSLFAFDGYPFTRQADLGEAAVVLPDRPTPPELSMALSVLGQLAQITGRVGTRVTFLGATAADDARLRDRDVLAIGSVADNALLRRWARSLPLPLGAKAGAQVRSTATAADLLELLGGIGPLLDARRATSIAASARDLAAIEAFESPASPGRSAIAVVAAAAEALPPFETFLGYAEGRTRAGDLLLQADGARWMFRVGPSYSWGGLDAWTRLRWFLATHWLALLPLLLVAALALASSGNGALSRRMRARLRPGEAR